MVTVHAHREAHRIQRPYQGTYQSARRYVLHTLANTGSATLRRRVLQYVEVTACPRCEGTGLRPEALAVRFAGLTIGDLTGLPLDGLATTLRAAGSSGEVAAWASWSSCTNRLGSGCPAPGALLAAPATPPPACSVLVCFWLWMGGRAGVVLPPRQPRLHDIHLRLRRGRRHPTARQR